MTVKSVKSFVVVLASAVVIGAIVGVSHPALADCPDCAAGLVTCTQSAVATLNSCVSTCRTAACAETCVTTAQATMTNVCRADFGECVAVCPQAPSDCASCGTGFSDCVQTVIGNLTSCLTPCRNGYCANTCLAAAKYPFAECQVGLSSCINTCAAAQ